MNARNWQLLDVFGSDARCDNCNAHLKLVFMLQQDDDVALVGCECVKAYTTTCDARAAARALNTKWRVHRHYYFKRIRGLVWSIGRNPNTNRWWVAYGHSVYTHRLFVTGSFDTFDAARLAAIRCAVSGEYDSYKNAVVFRAAISAIQKARALRAAAVRKARAQ